MILDFYAKRLFNKNIINNKLYIKKKINLNIHILYYLGKLF